MTIWLVYYGGLPYLPFKQNFQHLTECLKTVTPRKDSLFYHTSTFRLPRKLSHAMNSCVVIMCDVRSKNRVKQRTVSRDENGTTCSPFFTFLPRFIFPVKSCGPRST